MKYSIKNHFRSVIPILILAAFLTGCSTPSIPQDQYFTAPAFSTAIQVNSKGETHGSLIVTNTGEDVFPKDDQFEAAMNLWNSNGSLRAKIESPSISKIQPGESVFPASTSWHLDPGIYILTWGSPKYGGVMTIFTVIEKESRLYLGKTRTFRTKPVIYEVAADRAGRVRSFNLDNNGTLTIQGETPIPDNGCIFPLLLGQEGIVDEFPTGVCVQIADGQWQMQIPSDSTGSGIPIEPDTSYQVILFADDLSVPPSEPFTVQISPPPNQ